MLNNRKLGWDRSAVTLTNSVPCLGWMFVDWAQKASSTACCNVFVVVPCCVEGMAGCSKVTAELPKVHRPVSQYASQGMSMCIPSYRGG